MKKCILLTLLVPTLALAEPVSPDYAPLQQQKPDSQKDCEQILQAFGAVQVAASQADLVSQVQKGVVVICKRAIEAEKKAAAAPTPTPEEVK